MNFKTFIAENDTYFLFLWFGIVAGLVGLLITRQEKKIRNNCTVETSGVFDHFNRRYNMNRKKQGRSSVMYNPTYRYQYDGTDYFVKSGKSSNTQYNFRQDVTVRLNPNKPGESYIAEEKSMALFPLLICIAGFATTAYALARIIINLIH